MPTNFTSPKPIASFFSASSASSAIQSTRPEPTSSPCSAAVPLRRPSTRKIPSVGPCSAGTRQDSSTPKRPAPSVNTSGMIMWSRSMNVAAMSTLTKTMPHAALAGGNSSQQARKSPAVSSSTNA